MLKCVEPFAKEYDVLLERDLTEKEMKNEGNWNPWAKKIARVDKTIRSPLDAAQFLGANKLEKRLDRFVQHFLNDCPEYKSWLELMPVPVPDELVEYQDNYVGCDLTSIDCLVKKYGATPPDGQYLFHGGVWPRDKYDKRVLEMITTRVLSTSLCPKVALDNADWRGKSWDAGRLDLIVIHVKSPVTPAFIFDKELEGHGHELEVLFASGAKLHFIDETLLCSDWEAYKNDHNIKNISTYLINAELN